MRTALGLPALVPDAMKPGHRRDHGSTAEEAALIAAAVAGRANALQELVERYEPRVYRFAMRVCRNPEDAQEILQDTFLNVIRSLASFRGASRFATWLFRIVVNSCTKSRARRAAMRARETVLDTPEGEDEEHPIHHELVDWSQDPQAATLSAEVRRRLDAAIDELLPGYKGVLLLRDIEGFSTADTAQILNVSPGAVKTRLHRARLFLRDRLSGYFADRRP
jgi:RNA polymerase sigma-70 factor (ECF subfamily)